ncbi:hypothetical protein IFM89_013599 [Coptis chinensis]|uniref:Uncharacterized protein n=1 Tax=Coptis chinensis TaxID=261450 RepID=A0A835LIG6_9MAGN|nr:hypothetical protein IFM89_013599 [Coptis chinensis]
MCKSRLYRNGVHGNEEEENKKKMKKGKNIDDRDPEPLSSRGKKREKERADFKQILADKGGGDVHEDETTRGQPIHEESKKLVSFLGAQARVMVDINIDNWKKVSNETKDSLWTVTKQKFVVPESARHITMRELGYLWRSSKSRFSRIIASCANEEERMEKRPKNIKLEWWKSFVRKRLSKEFQLLMVSQIWMFVKRYKNLEKPKQSHLPYLPRRCYFSPFGPRTPWAETVSNLGRACKVWVTNALEPSAKVWKASNGLLNDGAGCDKIDSMAQ